MMPLNFEREIWRHTHTEIHIQMYMFRLLINLSFSYEIRKEKDKWRLFDVRKNGIAIAILLEHKEIKASVLAIIIIHISSFRVLPISLVALQFFWLAVVPFLKEVFLSLA